VSDLNQKDGHLAGILEELHEQLRLAHKTTAVFTRFRGFNYQRYHTTIQQISYNKQTQNQLYLTKPPKFAIYICTFSSKVLFKRLHTKNIQEVIKKRRQITEHARLQLTGTLKRTTNLVENCELTKSASNFKDYHLLSEAAQPPYTENTTNRSTERMHVRTGT
jgi:hypothetical protein